MLDVPADEGPSQLLPEAIDVSESCGVQRRQVLVQGRRRGTRGSTRRRPSPIPPHRLEILGRGPFTAASRRGFGVVPPLHLGGRGIDQVQVQEDAARLQLRANLAIDLADARLLDDPAASNGPNRFGSHLGSKRSGRYVLKRSPYLALRVRARFSIGAEPSCAMHVA